MILDVGKDLMRTSKDHHRWFCKAARGKDMPFENGVGTYLDERLVAAEINGIGGQLHYIKVKGVLK